MPEWRWLGSITTRWASLVRAREAAGRRRLTSDRTSTAEPTAGRSSAEILVEDLACTLSYLVGNVVAGQKLGELVQHPAHVRSERIFETVGHVPQYGHASFFGCVLLLVEHEAGLIEIAHTPVERPAAALSAQAQ